MKNDFSSLSLYGLKKTGDIIIPGTDGFPAFSKTPFLNQIHRISDYMNPDDKAGFKILTAILGLTPTPLIRFLFWILKFHNQVPTPIAAIFRQVNVGLKGVIFTLYYSHLDENNTSQPTIMKMMDYESTINTPYEEDTEMETLLTENNPLNQKMGNNDTESIYKNARLAQTKIKNLSVKERLKHIKAIREILLSRQEEIIDVVQKETFKARTDILISEIFPILEHLEFLEHDACHALSPQKIKTPIAMMGKTSKVWFEPMGTVLVISPWNYPLYQAIVPITCSFVTGNATIYKPSEITPLKGLVESILKEAGFESNWAQVVYGDYKTGESLINGRPQKIFFTGSVNTGKKIMAQAANYLIPVELELGGKDPMIVFEDVNINRAVKGAVWGAFTNTGQSCTSVERLYVQESIYETFKTQLVQETKTISLGVDKDGNADMGAMISEKQILIVADLVKDALKNGAKMLTGESWDFKNKFIPPIILEGTTHQMRINQEEVFGPVLPIMKFKTEDEAITFANDSTFGLSASVWTKDKTRAERVASQIVTGNISINNVMLSEGNHALPFGGVKDSGIGRYKGEMGLRNFTNIKSVLVDANSSKIEANWYPYTKTKYQLFTSLTASLFSEGIKKWIGLVRFGLPLESHAQKAKRD